MYPVGTLDVGAMRHVQALKRSLRLASDLGQALTWLTESDYDEQ